jgi:hypothetical protein
MPTLRPDFHNGNLVSFSVATKQEAIVSLNYIRQPAPGGCLATFRSQRTTFPDRNKHDLWRFFAAKGGVSFEADGGADAYGFISSGTDGTLENDPDGTFNALLACYCVKK